MASNRAEAEGDIGSAMTADELLEFYGRYYEDGVTFREIFGDDSDFLVLADRFGPKGIAERIRSWKGTREL